MKWFLALVPLVAAAPSLPSYQAGDAPDPGQVTYTSLPEQFLLLTSIGQNPQGWHWRYWMSPGHRQHNPLR